MDDSRSPRPAIASAFSRPGIPGFIFIEGRPCDVADAVRDLVTVYRQRRLVPSEERSTLLTFRNPLYREIRDGEWVRCRHGLYRGDIGLVCEHDNSSEVELIVAFIPRIPDKHSGSAQKRKRPARPEPRKWSAHHAKAVWGDKVRKISDEEYKLKDETYKSGLVLKHFPPASVVVSSPPSDIVPFVTAPYISSLPFYSSVRMRYIQDTIKVGQRVKVIYGEQQGLVGHTIDISDGTANVIPTDDIAPPMSISLRALAPLYAPGDHVKYRCTNTQGIVSVVREEDMALTFVTQDTHEEVRTVSLTQDIYCIQFSDRRAHGCRGAMLPQGQLLSIQTGAVGRLQRPYRFRSVKTSRLYHGSGGRPRCRDRRTHVWGGKLQYILSRPSLH